MKIRIICGLTAILLSGITPAAAQDSFREARDLYNQGLYDRAKVLFNRNDDILSRGYALMCDLKTGTEGAWEEAELYVTAVPESVLVPQIEFLQGTRFFDKGDFAKAAVHFDRISDYDLDPSLRAEYLYKNAYSHYASGNRFEAEQLFNRVLTLPYSNYSAPARYYLGYLKYETKAFPEAAGLFELAAEDPRFSDIAGYYLLECRFMMKDYGYVIEKSSDLFARVPEDRRPHLARIISESYLVKGDKSKAKEYYEKQLATRTTRTRTDWFYAGTLLFTVKDYEGSIANFSKMNHYRDSLGQIATYQMGYSYIETRNKVAAMDAFRQASSLEYDQAIKEDAFYNYAKLTFDLNHDTSAFYDYLDKYGGKGKDDRIYSYMAMASLYSHDYEGAVAAYDKIDELDENMKGNYMKAYYMRANQLIINGAWRDAIPCLKAAAYYVPRQNPFNQMARYWLAESYYRTGDYYSAREVLTDLYNLSALDGKIEGDLISYQMAYAFFQEEKYSDALKWFQNYLATTDRTFASDAQTRIGDCYFFRQDYRTAISAYERKLSAYPDPDDIYPYFRAGLSAGLLGDNGRKIRFLEQVKSAAPSVPYYSEAMYELGRAYVTAGDSEDAMRTFKTLRSTTSDMNYVSRSLIEMGMISRNLGKYDKALSFYKQVIETVPGTDDAEAALLAIESIYRVRQEPDAYLAYVSKLGDKANRSEEQKENVYFSTAEQIYLSGDYAKGVTVLEHYLAQYPDAAYLAKAEFYLGECCRGTNRKEEAADYYQRSIKDGIDGAFLEVAYLQHAKLSYSLGRYKDALESSRALKEKARMEENRSSATVGIMRAAFKARLWPDALAASDDILSSNVFNADIKREATFVKAKSCLGMSRRAEAFTILEGLAAAYPSTAEGAEASYMIIQDLYDQGRFEEVENRVYDFSAKSGSQNYWLAKCYIVLGDSFVELGNMAQAEVTFESVSNGYRPAPGTEDDIRDQIALRLKKLSEIK